LWLALAGAAAIRTFLRPESHTVFPLFAASAVHWWNDQPLYVRYESLDYFRYPPLFAVAVTPFRVPGLVTGGILWTWFGMAVFAAGLYRFARDVLPREWSRERTALFLALGALGGLRGFWNAQSNALVVGMLLLAASAVVRRRWWTGAFLLAGSVWIKLTPLAPALLLCSLWPRRLAGRFAVGLAVGFLLPFLTRPPETVLGHYREWAEHLRHSGSERWPGFRDAWTVWVVLRHLEAGPVPLREPMDAAWYRVVQLASAAAVLAWCLGQRRRGASMQWLVQLSLSMGVAWLMLFGPAVEHATYVFLAPPLLAGALDAEAWPRGRWLIRTAFVLIMGLGWGTLTRPLQDGFPLVLVALPAGTALFMAWLVGFARDRAVVNDKRERERGACPLIPAPARTSLQAVAKPFPSSA
jgi:hypothetical protein